MSLTVKVVPGYCQLKIAPHDLWVNLCSHNQLRRIFTNIDQEFTVNFIDLSIEFNDDYEVVYKEIVQCVDDWVVMIAQAQETTIYLSLHIKRYESFESESLNDTTNILKNKLYYRKTFIHLWIWEQRLCFDQLN